MKRVKGCLGVFLIFFFGVLFGCAVTDWRFHERVLELVAGGPEKFTKEIVNRLNKDLKLDSDQREMLEQIAMDTRIKLRTIRQSTQPEVDRTLYEAADRLRGILDPKQAKKFDEMIKKGHDKWKTSRPIPKPTPPAPAAEDQSVETPPAPEAKSETP